MNNTIIAMGVGALLGLQLVQYWQSRRRFGKLDRLVSRVEAAQAANTEVLRGVVPEVGELLATETAASMRVLDERLTAQQLALDDLPSHMGYLLSLANLTSAYPVFLGEASLDAFTLRALVDRIERQRPKVILELGSGSSTMIIAAVLDKLGMSETRHIAVDHDEFYLGATQRNFARHGFRSKTEFWLCPLEREGDDEIAWYGGLLGRLGGTQVDLVLVDGPPASFHPLARRPALPKLEAFMASGAALILDDASRPDERQTIRAWRKAFPAMRVNVGHRGKGFAVFNKVAEDSASTG